MAAMKAALKTQIPNSKTGGPRKEAAHLLCNSSIIIPPAIT
jgi:hypothetical protein